jgi:polysaccharide pyruvyl transferase CsaB
MTSTLISGYYGLGNIGDEVILTGMIASLRRSFPEIEITVLSADPSVTESMHGVRAISHPYIEGPKQGLLNALTWDKYSELNHEIDACDLFILGGGSLIQDLKPAYLPAWFSLLKSAMIKGKKTAVFGIGAGPVDTRTGQWLCREVLNRVDLVMVRDQMSIDALQRCGVNDVILGADPAFGMIPIDFDGLKERRRTILSVREPIMGATTYRWLHDSDIYRNPSIPALDQASRQHAMGLLLRELSEANCMSTLFVPTVKSDISNYREISAEITHGSVQVAEWKDDSQYVLSLLSGCKVLCGMRLHSLIMATMVGVPFVPISYCGKVKSFLESMKMENLYLDVEELGTDSFRESLIKNFDQELRNNSNRSVYLMQKAEEFKVKVDRSASILREVVQG